MAEGVDDDVAGDAGVCVKAQQESGVVVEPVDDFDICAVSEAPVGEVGLPGLVGLVCLEADVGGLGRLRGSGVTRPAFDRIRLMVDAAGEGSPSWSSRSRMDWGPASKPASRSCLRRVVIRSRVSTLVLVGLVWGLRDLGSRASRPPFS